MASQHPGRDVVYMPQTPPEPMLTEPAVVPPIFFTGATVEVVDHLIKFVLWSELVGMGGEKERRIVGRFVTDISTARIVNDLVAEALEHLRR